MTEVFPRVALVWMVLSAAPALAIRPFITDDARVVGDKLVQLETWGTLEDGLLIQWVAPSFGPTEWLEVSVAFTHGAQLYDPAGAEEHAQPGPWGIAGPLVQAKFLVRHAEPNQLPGVAVAVGSLLPFGHAHLRAAPGFFLYAAITESLGENERVLIHANLGVGVRSETTTDMSLLAGAGTQIRLFAGLHGVAELVYGDAFTGIDAFAVQGGFRYILNEHVQFDATVGGGVAGEPRPLWVSAGIRLVSADLW
ncbi:MAG: hypothetical protein JNM17_27940 [Archangium sp.]|nr:hypothetical protein [Archangium sp.]